MAAVKNSKQRILKKINDGKKRLKKCQKQY